MVLPLLAAGIGVAYGGARALTNWSYWNDYKKRTGYYPKYGFLRGPGASFGYGLSTFNDLKKM